MSSTSEMYTITFGDVAENHFGMQKVGKMADSGFNATDLMSFAEHFKTIGCDVELKDLCLGQDFSTDDAYVLIARNAVDKLLGVGLANELYEEQSGLAYDTQAKMRGRVVNKRARYNLCFGDKHQEADMENGKGTIYSFNELPLLSKVREELGKINDKSKNLNAEGNHYYDMSKCGIGYHGDAERKMVIAIRLYGKNDENMNRVPDETKSSPIHYIWFKRNEPVSERIDFDIGHGDIYIMSEKATGFDWRKSSTYTLRHAAGCDKYVTK